MDKDKHKDKGMDSVMVTAWVKDRNQVVQGRQRYGWKVDKERIQKGKDKDKYKVKGMDSVLNGDYMYLGYKPGGVLKAMVAQRWDRINREEIGT